MKKHEKRQKGSSGMKERTAANPVYFQSFQREPFFSLSTRGQWDQVAMETADLGSLATHYIDISYFSADGIVPGCKIWQWPNRDQDGGSEGGTSNGVIKLNAEGDWCGFKLCLKLDHIYGVLSGERGIGQCRHLNQWVWITMTTGLEWQSNVITENI